MSNAARATNAVKEGGSHVALNTVLLPAEAPEWVELIPAGPFIQGRDGRSWLFDQVSKDQVLATFTQDAVDLPIDWEHATEHRAPQGLEAPAAAWIKALELREGALWARVEWTGRGAAAVQAREYRYLSPVFAYDIATGRIVRLASAGLTNQPNLHLTALNTQEHDSVNPLLAKLIKLLGLPDDTTEEVLSAHVEKLKATDPAKLEEAQAAAKTAQDEAVAAKTQVETLTAENARLTKAQPNLTTHVPRTDFDALSARLATAENSIKTDQEARAKASVETAINAAVTEGKITPASRAYYEAQCMKPGGLEEFKAFCSKAPRLVPDNAAGDGSGADAGADGLDADQIALCTRMGIKPADFAKNLQ